MSFFNNVFTRQADSPSIDAFARARVSNPASLFDGKAIGPAGISQWDDQEVSGGGTGSSWDADTASIDLTVSATTAGKRVRQTYSRYNYQPGKSHMILITGVFGVSATGITRRVGYFDANNGIFLEIGPTAISVGIRNNTSDTKVTQANWNLDKMDGTGASGITLDFSKAQIFFIDMEWLGVGRVRCGFVIDGIPVYCHQFLHANSVTDTYMGSPNQPIRYEIENDGTGEAATLKCICSNVSSEGGQEPIGSPRATTGVPQTSIASDVNVPIAGIRHQSAYIDTAIRLLRASILATSNNDSFWLRVCVNPTFAAAPTWTNVPASSLQEITAAGTTITDLGLVIAAAPVFSRESQTFVANIEAPLGAAIDGTPQELVLVATPITSGITMYGSISWLEYH